MAVEKQIKNVKLWRGSGKNAEFLEAFEKMPKEKELRDFVSQHYGHGFYYLAYHDGQKPQKRVFVIDRMQTRGLTEPPSVQLSGNKNDGSEYLYDLLKVEVRDLKNSVDELRKDMQIAISLLREAVEDTGDDDHGEDEGGGALADILKNAGI